MTRKEHIGKNYRECIVFRGRKIQVLIKFIINKYLILLIGMITISTYINISRTKENIEMDEVQNNATLPLIGEKAPAFHAVTTQGDINFPEDYKGKWVILFSHPC